MSAERPGDAAGPGGAAGAARPAGLARPLLSLLAAAACVSAIVGLARIAVGTARGQRLDQLILSGAEAHEGPLSEYAALAVRTVSVPVVAVLLALAVLLVLLRRRPALLVPIGAVVLGANLTTQVVKHLVVSREVLGPGIDVTPNSFPSGHTTLAATAMIALVLAAGRGRVVLAPVGALWTVAAGLGTLVVGWHRPSDVVGAIAVVAAWTFLVLALDGLDTRRRDAAAGARSARGPRRRRTARTAPSPRARRSELAVAALLGLGGVLALGGGALGMLSLRLPLDLQDAAQQVPAFAAAAAVIAGGTAAWMALVLVLRTPISHRERRTDRVP